MTDATTTTFVRYLLPGVFLPEESTKRVDARNPQEAATAAPPNAYAFSFYDIVKASVEVGKEVIVTQSKDLNPSKTYYIDAELIDGVNVRCRTGNVQPYSEDQHEIVATR